MKFKMMVIGIMGLFLLLGCGKKEAQPEMKSSKNKSEVKDPHNFDHHQGMMMIYEAPKTWGKETPSSSMRLDQYRLPGKDGAGDAVMAVFHFPGTGGDVEGNLNRWYGQFKHEGGKTVKDKAKVEHLEVNGLPVTTTFATGTYLESKSGMMMGGDVVERPDYAMWAAIAETQDGPWFFKAVGPEKTIKAHMGELNGFVKTFRAH
ncbi:MAG: hypothetical protein Kow0037_07890 [Calditrichia bacterium]